MEHADFERDKWLKTVSPDRKRYTDPTGSGTTVTLTSNFGDNKITIKGRCNDINIENHETSNTIELSFDGAAVHKAVQPQNTWTELDIYENEFYLRSAKAAAKLELAIKTRT